MVLQALARVKNSSGSNPANALCNHFGVKIKEIIIKLNN